MSYLDIFKPNIIHVANIFCKVMEYTCAKFNTVTPFDPQIEILQIVSNFFAIFAKNLIILPQICKF